MILDDFLEAIDDLPGTGGDGGATGNPRAAHGEEESLQNAQRITNRKERKDDGGDDDDDDDDYLQEEG